MPNIGHDTGAWEENTGFEPIPAGEYKAIIVASEVKTTSAGDGEYLKLELQIVEGKFENRKLWDNLNLKNPNDLAVKIARGTLTSICKAIGKSHVEESEELHNKPLFIKVAIEKRRDTGEDQNKIKGYKAVNGNGNGHSAPTEPQLSQAGPPATGGKKPPSPWAKK